MNKRELAMRIASTLREQGARKAVSFPKHTFRISDNDGNQKDFVVKRSDAQVLYTVEDIYTVLGGLVDVIHDALREGESITLNSIGTLRHKFVRAKRVKGFRPEAVTLPAHYTPNFAMSSALRDSVRVYQSMHPIPEELLYDESATGLDDMIEDGGDEE